MKIDDDATNPHPPWKIRHLDPIAMAIGKYLFNGKEYWCVLNRTNPNYLKDDDLFKAFFDNMDAFNIDCINAIDKEESCGIAIAKLLIIESFGNFNRKTTRSALNPIKVLQILDALCLPVSIKLSDKEFLMTFLLIDKKDLEIEDNYPVLAKKRRDFQMFPVGLVETRICGNCLYNILQEAFEGITDTDFNIETA